jgi:multisubunit Na+/H+ antiporter MnhF subunit
MTGTNPAAPHHIPWFVSSPDGSDPLLVVTAFILLAATLLIGVLFFTLHSLPERLGHKKFQFEIVAVLALISLFTHMHIFWVAALILALIDLPDFTTPLGRIASALETRPSTGRQPPIEAPGKEKTDGVIGRET